MLSKFNFKSGMRLWDTEKKMHNPGSFIHPTDMTGRDEASGVQEEKQGISSHPFFTGKGGHHLVSLNLIQCTELESWGLKKSAAPRTETTKPQN